MSPIDKKAHALATHTLRPRLRRTFNTHHYALPKPYRRQRMLEERPRWKRKLGFYVVSGLVIGTLIGQIADMAEEARRERELPIIAALDELDPGGSASLPAQPAVPASAPADGPAALPSPAPPTPPEHDAGDAPGLAAPGKESSTAPVSPREKKSRPPAGRSRSAAPAPGPAAGPDPDVVLVSAILMLGPLLFGEPEPAAAECPADAPSEAACAQLHGMLP